MLFRKFWCWEVTPAGSRMLNIINHQDFYCLQVLMALFEHGILTSKYSTVSLCSFTLYQAKLIIDSRQWRIHDETYSGLLFSRVTFHIYSAFERFYYSVNLESFSPHLNIADVFILLPHCECMIKLHIIYFAIERFHYSIYLESVSPQLIWQMFSYYYYLIVNVW